MTRGKPDGMSLRRLELEHELFEGGKGFSQLSFLIACILAIGEKDDDIVLGLLRLDDITNAVKCCLEIGELFG
jgi:hypothetical protein